MTDNIIFSNSLPPQNHSSNFSITGFNTCFFSRPDSIIFIAYSITNILLLLPLCIIILYYGLQRWQQRCSSSSLTSHSDWFTYHTVIMELFGVVGCFLSCCAVYRVDITVLFVSLLFYNFNWGGQTYFHILTCVERYLAVVHPITYLHLRNEKGIRVRNISIGCVWLLCILGVGVSFKEEAYLIGNFGLLILALIIVSFCSVSVLRVLIGPGPGEHAGGRERTDQSKQRAFYTIMAILGVLVMRLSFGLIEVTLLVLNVYSSCKLGIYGTWLNVPSSLVLPFLFLQRAGKLERFKRNQSTDQQSNSHK